MLFALLLSLPGLSNALPGSFPSKIAAGTYFPSFDDKPIFYNEWIPSDKPIARVIAIPGLGDHIRRYSELFDHLNAHGIYVQGMDPRGFGETVRVNHEEKGYSRFKSSLKTYKSLKRRLEIARFQPFCTAIHWASLGLIQGGVEILAFTQKFADKIPNYRGTVASSPALGTINGVSFFDKLLLGASNFIPFGPRIQHKNPVDPTDGGLRLLKCQVKGTLAPTPKKTQTQN